MSPRPVGSLSEPIIVGQGSFTYQVEVGWPNLPEGYDLVDGVGVVTDAADRVYLFNRGTRPMMIFEPDGSFVGSWGEASFVRPHGIHATGSGMNLSCTSSGETTLWCTDDLGHCVREFSLDGKLLRTLGPAGTASDTGTVGFDYRHIAHGAGPYNLPTNLAVGPSGELYVADGYGNCRVHRFSPEGELMASWGEPGDGPGEFHVPHGIAVDRTGRVWVADRENSRIQRFSPDGRFLDAWTDVVRPCEVFIDANDLVYVAELGLRAGPFPWMTAGGLESTGGRLSIFTLEGELLARWGGGPDPCAPGDFFAPHDVWVDRRGNIYLGEVVTSAGGSAGLVAPDCHRVQKFTKIANS